MTDMDANVPISKEVVEEALNPLIYQLMEELKIAGAAVAVVRGGFDTESPRSALGDDGRGQATYVPPFTFARGYGYSNVSKNEVVDIHTTCFNTGSCARVLTCMAAMQLRQEDALDDMADVNRYLPIDLQVDSAFREKASICHLLTHTSGYSDKGASQESAEATGPHGSSAEFGEEAEVGGTIARHIRENCTGIMRVSPPGTIYRECDYNYLLVGALVECISGLDYEKYVTRRLLSPLRLRSLGPFRRTVREALRPPCTYMVDRQGSRSHTPQPEGRQSPLTPVTGLVVTPEDMSRVLLSLVQGLNDAERGGGGGVLSDGMLAQMQKRHFSNHQVELAYGFMRRKVWPSGATMLYHSADEAKGSDAIMVVLPHEKAALWVVTNTTPLGTTSAAARSKGGRAGDGRFCERVVERFVERFSRPTQSKSEELAKWMSPVQPLSLDPLLTLYCFPYAAGSAPLIFETWPRQLPDFMQVVAVQLPGRGTRVKDPPCSDLRVSAENLADVMAPSLPSHPFVLFGHGMGAILAYEVARCLHIRYDRAPMHLLLSGSAAPVCGHSDGGPRWRADPSGAPCHPSVILHNLPDSELVEALMASGRIPRHFRRNSLMLRAMLGTVRADLAAEEKYEHQMEPHYATPTKGVALANGALSHTFGVQQKALSPSQQKLPCAMTVYLGINDEEVGEGGAEAWGELGSDGVTVHRLPGDHFYLEEVRSQELLLRSVTQTLSRRLTRHVTWISQMTTPGRRGSDAGF